MGESVVLARAGERAVSDDGCRYWWHLSNVHLLSSPYPVRGNVGMWQIDKPLSAPVESSDCV